MPDLIDLRTLPGLVATCITGAIVAPEFSDALAELRSYNDRNGIHKVEYKKFYAALVEEGRDNAVRHMLKEKYAWVLQIDADAGFFPADSVMRMLTTLYHAMPHAHVLGGYCQLKGYPYFPTIDTGTGTWEEHYPGEGVIPVIRTGAHFFMCKREAFAMTGPPWFRTRLAEAPLHAMIDVDNFARTRLGGENPFAKHAEWETLMMQARKLTPSVTHVGEDSSFFDKLRAVGGHAYVDTDLVVGHTASKTISPTDFIDAMKKHKQTQAACVGLR